MVSCEKSTYQQPLYRHTSPRQRLIFVGKNLDVLYKEQNSIYRTLDKKTDKLTKDNN